MDLVPNFLVFFLENPAKIQSDSCYSKLGWGRFFAHFAKSVCSIEVLRTVTTRMSKFKSEPARPSVSSRLQLLVWFLAVSAHWLLATSASSIMPPDAYLTSGTKLQEDGKLEQAAHHFRAAMRSLPSKEGGWLAAFNLGRVLNDLGRPEEAQQALERAGQQEFIHINTPRPGPLAFPLLVERLNNRMSNESVLERVLRMRDEALRREH